MTDRDAGDGRENVQLLIERTEGRVALQKLQDVYSRRLHRRSDDFEATRGLSLVNAKLQRASLRPPVVTSAS